MYRVESYGFRIADRATFMADPAIRPYGEEHAAGNARQGDLLVARASAIPGAYVLYDPDDDAEGFMLIGDDPHELDREGFEHLADERGPATA